MRISFLSTFYPYRGGIAQFNANLFLELSKTNSCEAFTFTRQYPNFLFPGETQYVTDKDKVDEIPAKRVLDTINPFTWFSAAKKIKRSNPDVVITKYWMTFFGPSLGKVLSGLSKKTVRISILDNVIPHEKRFFDGFANRYFLKQNDGFVVMSDAVLKDLLSIKPDAKYIRVDHPIYDHFGEKMNQNEAKSKLGLDLNKKYALFFGFIRGYKGLDVLIEAAQYLADDVEIIIAGEVYGSFDTYESQINQLGVGHKIKKFVRYIGDPEVPAFFSASDVCILPYKSATQSGITSIAMHFELPIIATNVGGLAELVHHEKTGIIVEKPDGKLVADAINNYFTTSKSTQFQEALRLEKEQHSWSNFSKKILDFAENLKK